MKEQKKKEYSPVVRDLMVAIEFMRRVCEHAEGRTKEDRKRLTDAMSVGIRVNARHKNEVPDYQHETFWDDVNKIRRLADV